MTSNHRPKAVVFDMDGLMFNTEDVYTAVGSELLRRRGHRFEKDLKDAMMGLAPQPAFEMMIRWHDLADPWESLSTESEALFLEYLDDILAPMPGLPELLDCLTEAGMPRAIATSSRRAVVDACLGPFDMHGRFQHIFTAEDITRSKPDPEIYQKACRTLGVEPAEALVLEDSHNGCLAAAAAGAYVVAVPSEHSRDHDFSMADLVADSLRDRRLYEALGLTLPEAHD